MEYVQIRMENIYLLIENMWKSYGGMMEKRAGPLCASGSNFDS